MELAGLVISIVSLASLCDTCVSLIERLESFHRFEKEKSPLLNQLLANRLILQDWSRQVGITNDGNLLDQHLVLDVDRREVVHRLLSNLRDVLSTSIPEKLGQDADSEEITGLTPIPDTSLQIDASSNIDLAVRPAVNRSRRDQFKWAFGRAKPKLQEQVKVSTDLIEKLRQLVPPERNPGSSASEVLEDTLKSHPWSFKFDKQYISSSELPRAPRERLKTQSRYTKQELEALRVSRSGVIRDWLSVAPYEDLYHKRLSERQVDTCLWIQKQEDYVRWASTDDLATRSRIFWLYGPGGRGKSVLCASVVENLLSTGAEVGHFFCTSNSQLQKNVASIINTFVWQLAMSNDTIFGGLMRWFENIWPRTPSEDDMWTFFRQAVECAKAPVLIIDGLDECRKTSIEWKDGSDSVRISFLLKLADCVKDGKVRVMIFSREEADILEGISCCEESGCALYTHRITTSDVQPDLTVFAQKTVQSRLKKKPEEVQDEIAERIANKSDGMFLWIKLQGSNLRDTKNKQQLIRIIEEMPHGLDNLFARDWEQMQKLRPDELKRALSILMWLAFAVRPLRVAELTEALAILEKDELPDLIDEEYIRKEILGLCASLITAEEVSGQLCAGSIVTFSHFSAKNFALNILSNQPTCHSKSLNGSFIVQLCIKYLMETSTWRHMMAANRGSSPPAFLSFAVETWPMYLSEEFLNEPDITYSINSFFSLQNELWKYWRDTYEYIERQRRGNLVTDSCIPGGREYYSAYFHLLPTMKFIDQEQSCDWDIEGGFYGSPLKAACTRGSSGTIEFLLGQNVDINREGCHFGSALNAAAARGALDIVRRLIEAGADVNIPNNELAGALHYAAAGGHIEVVKLLLDQGAVICVGDFDGATPLHDAASNGHVEVAELLLDHGADIDTVDNDDWTPLYSAVWQGHVRMTKFLLERGADVNIADIGGWTPFQNALWNGHVNVTKLLLEMGAKISVYDIQECIPLKNAALSGYLEATKLLIDQNLDVSVIKALRFAALMSAAMNGYVEAVEWFLSQEYMFTAMKSELSEALRIASNEGHFEVAERLLAANVDIHGSGHDGKACGTRLLQEALCFGHLEMVDTLITHGCSISAVDWVGRTALHTRVHEHSLEFLEENEGSTELAKQVDSLGCTMLHYVVRTDDIEVVRWTITTGVELHKPDNRGWTPLHWAAYFGHALTIEYLLELGSSPTSRDCIGRSPGDLAILVGAKEATSLLLKDSEQAKSTSSRSALRRHSAICDGCENDVYGSRFRCQSCWDFDLCFRCFLDRDIIHPNNHEFLEISQQL